MVGVVYQPLVCKWAGGEPSRVLSYPVGGGVMSCMPLLCWHTAGPDSFSFLWDTVHIE